MDDPAAVVDAVLEEVGPRIVLATPLGVGKANRIVNELYDRAVADPGIDLEIITALGLVPPHGSSDLERRLVEPIAARLFGDYPAPRFEVDMRRDAVPPNVRVRSFYFQAGSVLHSSHAQRHHVSVNYSDVPDVVAHAGVNVLAQLVAPGPDGSVSLSCNPDLTHEALDTLAARRAAGHKVVACAEVNRNLPYMRGADAEIDGDAFDLTLDMPGRDFFLAGPPKQPVGPAEHMIGLHASALVRDGGTLQIGIGALSDAIVWMLRLRHLDPAAHAELRRAAGGHGVDDLSAAIGGEGPFRRGLYACSEMLVDGFLDLMDAGILRRRAYDDVDTQRRADGAPADAAPLPGGHVAHAAFFLGPPGYYDRLRSMPDATRDLIGMTRVRTTNTLDDDRELRGLQRRHARFVNTAMQVTLEGASLADAVEPGRVVSGVGGQADFVEMAHALPDARALTLVRATRGRGADVASNVVWDHRHVTIPRQQRDIVVTEYGAADLRGRDQTEVAAALVEIADARFQEALVDDACAAGVLPAGHAVSDRARTNRPERLAADLARHRRHLPTLPFGSDLTHEEIVLAGALRHVDGLVRGRRWRDVDPGRLRRAVAPPPAAAAPYLERLGLDRPSSLAERAWQRVVVYGLAATGALDHPDDDAGSA